MSMNDTVAYFLTRIRNACQADHEEVQIPYSKLSENIGRVLAKEGFISGMEVVGEGEKKVIVIRLKYVDGNPVITNLSRVSKLSRRVYVGYKDINPVRNGLGLAILSTPRGVMSDTEARKQRVGGEILCNVW